MSRKDGCDGITFVHGGTPHHSGRGGFFWRYFKFALAGASTSFRFDISGSSGRRPLSAGAARLPVALIFICRALGFIRRHFIPALPGGSFARSLFR